MVFDKFKSWRNATPKGEICPSCQHVNQEGTKVCTRCYYQIDRAAFQQDSDIGDTESSDLLDELMSSLEKEEISEEPAPPSFAMDDLTVEVAQYEDGEEILLNSQPDLASMIKPTEAVEEEDYELTSEDIPLYVKKFEVPENQEEVEDEIEIQKIELIHPNAETPEFVNQVPASEIPEVSSVSNEELDTQSLTPGDFDGDGKVDEFEAAFANERKEPARPITQIPSAPSLDIPNIEAKPTPSHEKKEDGEGDVEQRIPSAPVFHSEGYSENGLDVKEVKTSFWPWHQEDEWAAPEIIKQLQAAITSAKEHNIAQATVLLDEVGPHLGNRTSLIYSVGRLLMSIGRDREAKRMVESANDSFPDNEDVQRAMEKLIS